jgi:hypothetical protein
MGNNITMTCCSSEEIIPPDDPPNLPSVYTYPDEQPYNFPRADSELTRIALEDYKKT